MISSTQDGSGHGEFFELQIKTEFLICPHFSFLAAGMPGDSSLSEQRTKNESKIR